LCAPLIGDEDLALRDGDSCSRLDEVSEEMAGLRDVVAIANPATEDAIQAAGHKGKQGDLQGHRGTEGVHVEEVNGVGNAVPDDHTAGVAFDHG